MNRRRGSAVGTFAAIVGALTAACTINFDRFDPVDARAAGDTASPQVSSGAPGGMPPDSDASSDTALLEEPEGGPTADATVPDDAADVQSPQSDAAPDRSPSCTAPPTGCITQARSCAATCAGTEQQCLQNCGSHNCNRCTSQEQSCATGCTTTCTTCAHQAGCSVNGECAAGIDAGGGAASDSATAD